MKHDTSDPIGTDRTAVVRGDLGGWISGPCLAAHLTPEPAHPPVLNTVLLIAELGQELPLWRVSETRAGWTGVRIPVVSGGEPLRLTRITLTVLGFAMTAAELDIVRSAWPGWSIRRAEHGPGWLATRGGPPVLHGRTLGQLAEQVAAHGDGH